MRGALPFPRPARSLHTRPASSFPGIVPRQGQGPAETATRDGSYAPLWCRPAARLHPARGRRGGGSDPAVPRPIAPGPGVGPSQKPSLRPLGPGQRGRRLPPGSRMGPDWNPACPAGATGRAGGKGGRRAKKGQALQLRRASAAPRTRSRPPWGSSKSPDLTSLGSCRHCCPGQDASFPKRPSWRHSARKCLAPRRPRGSEWAPGK